MIPYTTFKKLRAAGACRDRYRHLRNGMGKAFGDNTPLPLFRICELNGCDDALWVPDSIITADDLPIRQRLFAVACCQDVLHMMKDERSRNAVKVAHLFAHGEATEKELVAAWSASGFNSRRLHHYNLKKSNS